MEQSITDWPRAKAGGLIFSSRPSLEVALKIRFYAAQTCPNGATEEEQRRRFSLRLTSDFEVFLAALVDSPVQRVRVAPQDASACLIVWTLRSP